MNFTLAQALIAETLRLSADDPRIAVAIVDDHGELVAYARHDNCALQAGILAPNKAYTAARDRQPSKNLGQWAQTTSKDMGYWTDNKFTGLAGGLPIYVNHKVIGAIGISGLSQQADEDLAALTIANVLKDEPQSTK
jgi:glc operon protein GlcG